jgi:hypothetical protein
MYRVLDTWNNVIFVGTFEKCHEVYGLKLGTFFTLEKQ